MNARPLRDWLLVKQRNATPSGIVLPGNARPRSGIVLAVGGEVSEIASGDVIVWMPSCECAEIELDLEEGMVAVREAAVVAVLDDD